MSRTDTAIRVISGLVATERRGRSKRHYFNSEPLAAITQRWLIARKDAP